MLEKHPDAALRVYAVWIPMLWSDAREKWDGNVMPDARVMHFWDGERQAGQWFAKQVDGYDGTAWDMYYLYGPQATWETVPTPLVDSGGTIYSQHETLMKMMDVLLEK